MGVNALSFLASSAIHSFNPKKNGRLRVAKVYYNRVPYKGAGNYMVKSVVSGVINSIQPLGKNQKQIKIKDKKNKSATKSQNKKVKRQKRAKSKAIRQ